MGQQVSCAKCSWAEDKAGIDFEENSNSDETSNES